MLETQFEYFKHFLVCYFNISADFSDLKSLITLYKNTETEKTSKKLLSEVILLINMNDIDFVHRLVKEHGMRNLSKEKLLDMISTMRTMLS